MIIIAACAGADILSNRQAYPLGRYRYDDDDDQGTEKGSAAFTPESESEREEGRKRTGREATSPNESEPVSRLSSPPSVPGWREWRGESTVLFLPLVCSLPNTQAVKGGEGRGGDSQGNGGVLAKAQVRALARFAL